nr:MAG TPA: Microtubule integrity protein mal3 domain, microtubule-binding, coiled-coil, cell.33A [Caudoviricetes sp.]
MFHFYRLMSYECRNFYFNMLDILPTICNNVITR